jgi:hypothetical protein
MLAHGYDKMPSTPEEHNGKWAQEDFIFTKREEHFTNFAESQKKLSESSTEKLSTKN